MCGNFYAGVSAEVYLSGTISCSLKSDCCNDKDLVGEICGKIEGGNTLHVGAKASVELGGKWHTNLSAELIIKWYVSVKKCYTCSEEEGCSWEPLHWCAGAAIDLSFGLLTQTFTIPLVEGKAPSCGAD